MRESQTGLDPLLPASGEVDRLDGVLAGEPVARERPAELDFADGVPEVGRDGGSQVCQRPGIAEFKGVERVEHIDRLAVAEWELVYKLRSRHIRLTYICLHVIDSASRPADTFMPGSPPRQMSHALV